MGPGLPGDAAADLVELGASAASPKRVLILSGQRGILVAGWGGLQTVKAPETVHVVEDLPYDWLFPRIAAVVHHGGAGSTAEGLRAGKPTVVCPFFGDQPFWGRRVCGLGGEPRALPQNRLTAERLAEAIRVAVTDEDMRGRAAALGEKIRAEDGVQEAVKTIEDHLNRTARSTSPGDRDPEPRSD